MTIEGILTVQKFAQTNIQLFNQMADLGYSPADIEKVGDANRLAIRIFVGQYRGSGKPLDAHLAGTASVLAWIGRPASSVAAGLLHAALADGDFGGRSPQKVIEDEVGRDVYSLISAYHALKWSHTEEKVQEILRDVDTMAPERREALLIRVANELEDYLDLATHYYGRTRETAEENFRVNYMNKVEEPLRRTAIALGEPALADELSEHFSAVREATNISPRLRSGHHHMWLQAPASASPGIGSLVLNQVKQTGRRAKKARELGVSGTVRRIYQMMGR